MILNDSVSPVRIGLPLNETKRHDFVKLLYYGVAGSFWSNGIYRMTGRTDSVGNFIAYNQKNERVGLYPTYQCMILERFGGE